MLSFVNANNHTTLHAKPLQSINPEFTGIITPISWPGSNSKSPARQEAIRQEKLFLFPKDRKTLALWIVIPYRSFVGKKVSQEVYTMTSPIRGGNLPPRIPAQRPATNPSSAGRQVPINPPVTPLATNTPKPGLPDNLFNTPKSLPKGSLSDNYQAFSAREMKERIGQATSGIIRPEIQGPKGNVEGLSNLGP